MRIPESELEKYHIGHSEDIDELLVYDSYLKETDRCITEGFETLLASSSLTAFFTNLRNLNSTLRDTVNYRAIAREELNSIE